MAAVLSLLAPLLPWLVGAIGVVAVYFGIKQKGKSEARAEIAKEQDRVIAQQKARLDTAVAKDVGVEQKLEERIEDIKKESQAAPSSGVDKFRF